MKYFTMIQQDSAGVWGPEFGSYDKEEVAFEMRETLDHGVNRSEVAIVITEDSQAAIDAKLAQLNGNPAGR